MSRPKRNFAPMPLAVLASDCTPQEKLFVLAIMHHDWDGEKAWPSMDRISSLTGFKERTMREARQKLEVRGWIKSESRKGRSNIYSLDIPDMTLDQFNQALNPGTRRRGKENEGGTERHPTLALGAAHPGTERHPLNNRAIEAEPIEAEPLPAVAGKGKKHQEQDAFWEKAKASWAKKYPGEKFTWPNLSSFPKKLYAALEEFRADGLAMRWENMLNDKFTLPDMMKLVCDPNRYVKVRAENSNARAFIQPSTDWKPSGQKAPH